jgi:uncharacterized repeat protein (TIGR02543 family)
LSTYTITYNLNEGINENNPPTSFDITSDEITLPIPTRERHTFDGWFESSDFIGNAWTSIPAGTTENITLWARWIVNIYTITFNPTGGWVNPQFGTTITDDWWGQNWRLSFLPTPTKNGYAFTGWFTEEIGGVQVNTNTMFSENTTIFARWIATRTVTFNLNGGTGTTPATQVANDGSIITLPEHRDWWFSRFGFDFVGWNTEANGTGTSHNANTLFTPTGNITLYAIWAPIIYTITYNLNNGVNVSNPPISFDITSDEITLPIPTREGHTFDGWFTSWAMNGIPVTSIPASSTGDRTFWARWTQDPTSIRGRQNTVSRYGILLENAIVSDVARISVITPEQATINLRILDNLGNVVWTTTDVGANHHLPIIWDLRNQSGRLVANGTYLVIVEATGVSGKRYSYSARLGVSR